MDVSGAVCIITGAAQGLGLAFAARLLEAGARVCISDVNQTKGQLSLSQLRDRFGEDKVCFVKCDVSKEEEFIHLFDQSEEFFQVSCVDMLVNNAGVNTNHGWRPCMEVNIMAVMLGTEIALERMRKADKAGQIINTASMAAFGPGVREAMVSYTASKHGVVALTRTLARTTSGVAHKAICPSYADTEIVSAANTWQEDQTALARSIEACGGLMSPEFVAEGFYRLVTQCDSGAVMAVMPGLYFIFPDTSSPFVLGLVLLGRLCQRITGVSVVNTNHLLLILSTIIFLFLYFITLIL